MKYLYRLEFSKFRKTYLEIKKIFFMWSVSFHQIAQNHLDTSILTIFCFYRYNLSFLLIFYSYNHFYLRKREKKIFFVILIGRLFLRLLLGTLFSVNSHDSDKKILKTVLENSILWLFKTVSLGVAQSHPQKFFQPLLFRGWGLLLVLYFIRCITLAFCFLIINMGFFQIKQLDIKYFNNFRLWNKIWIYMYRTFRFFIFFRLLF